MRKLYVIAVAVATMSVAAGAQAFCGFYVARADTALFNRASQVVLVRDGQRTVMTMANDFRGDVSEFAVVIPVPTVLEREQINVAEPALIEHLDAYTAPRLVEYHDADPCRPTVEVYERMRSAADALPQAAAVQREARRDGVTIEAQYTVGEYDILILSAEESGGLIRWLKRNDYRLPGGAERVVGSYLKQGLKFFVARVNLEAQSELGFSYLRPLQVAYESPRFTLPIRLGTLNANGQQELYVYALTRSGRVETTNYRTVRIPSNVNVPDFVGEDFGEFYRAMFQRQVDRNRRSVFLEYAWDMNWCDPCAADPLTSRELRQLGVFWVGNEAAKGGIKAAAQDVFVTRLHLSYDANTFPDDLRFQETGDRSNYQGRYVIQRAWTGDLDCPAADAYRQSLAQRRGREAETVASLTGWPLAEVMRRMPAGSVTEEGPEPWWRRLWSRGEG